MRNINQLLHLMLDNQQLFKTCLCQWVYSLYFRNEIITQDEHFLLKQYIKNNRISKWESINAFLHQNELFWWRIDSIKPRVKWIIKHIKLTSI